MREKTLLLWGDTGVGKSTLLTAAFGTTPALAPLGFDSDAGSGSNDRTTLALQWADLRAGGFQPNTTSKVDYRFTCRNDGVLHVRDVKGGWVAEEVQVREQLTQANGVIFAMEAAAPQRLREAQQRAILATAALLQGKVSAVALTKADRLFALGHAAWSRYDGWIGSTGYGDFLQQNPVVHARDWWPVSALGFDDDSGLPACALGEYDYVVPCGVARPVNVRELFEHVLEAMGL